jgi:predicted ATPase/DNA-binding SARP family transcriptional activator
MDYRLLGPLDVVEDDRSVRLGGPKPRALLAILLIHRNTVVSVDTLVDALWGEEPPMAAENLVQTYVSRLRRALGATSIETRAPGYALRARHDDVDADRFTTLVARAAAARAGGELRSAASMLRAALAEWRGDPIADFRYEPWAAAEVDRLERSRQVATERAIHLELELGRLDEAIGELRALVGEDPLHEPWWELLVRALNLAGREADARVAYQRAEATLRDELGVEPGPRLRAQAVVGATDGAAADERHAAPQTAGTDPRRPRLPLVPTSFVGRDPDVEEVRGLILRRLPVTLVGPGGVGKTRLAVEVARRLLDEFGGAVWMVDLAALRPRSPVAAAVASALEVEVHDKEALEAAIVERLARRQALVVLDNCEHLLPQIARLAQAIVDGAPGVHLLATSRQPLGILGEIAWPVRPLAVAETGTRDRRGAAEALFVDRARAVVRDFATETAPVDESALTALCRRLDGMPLAIELAAPWLASLTLDELGDRLMDRFAVLATDSPVRIDRHRTLRATVDWSYRLLDAEEQRCLRHASVFAGGFDLAAAEAMCGPICRADVPVIDLIAGLVTKSMIVHEAGPMGSRYRLLETLREYASERLADDPEEERVARDRHAAHYLRMAEEAERQCRGPEQARWLAAVRVDEENFTAAFTWLRETDQYEPVFRIATLAWWYWEHRGTPQYGLERLLTILDGGPPPRDELLAPALHAAGSLAQTIGSHALAISLGRRALAAYRSVGDAMGVARSQQLLGRVATNRGDFVRADVLLNRAICAQRRGTDPWHLGLALHHLGLLNRLRGRYEEARANHEESLALFERVGDDLRIGYAHLMLGGVSLYEGDYADAADRAEVALERFERVKHRYGICHANQTLADARRLTGDASGSIAIYERCLAEFRDLGDRNCTASVLGVLALLARPTDAVRARALLLQSLDMRVQLRDVAGLMTVLEDTAALAHEAGRSELGVTLGAVASRVRGRTGAVEPGWHRRRVDDERRAMRATIGLPASHAAEARARELRIGEAVRLARTELGGRRAPRRTDEAFPVAVGASGEGGLR